MLFAKKLLVSVYNDSRSFLFFIFMMLEKEEIEAVYVKALKCESRLIIEILIKEIVLYNDKMEIYLNTPAKNGPDENRGFSFINKTINLRYYSKYSRLFVGKSAIINIRV